MDAKHTITTQLVYDYPTFQTRLKKLRTDRHLTYQDVSNIIGIDYHAYSKWETGNTKVYPKLENIICLADYYGVSVDYLIGRSDFKSPENDFINSQTGLSDDAIAGLQDILNFDDSNVGLPFRNIPYMDLLNFMFEKNYMLYMLAHMSNFFKPQYRFPVYRDKDGNYVLSSLGDNALQLSSVNENITPWNVHTVLMNDQYIDSIELRNMESTFRIMRDVWNKTHKSDV